MAVHTQRMSREDKAVEQTPGTTVGGVYKTHDGAIEVSKAVRC